MFDSTLKMGIQVRLDTCQVTFAELSDEFIAHYVDVYSPLDKAGAYGVQDLMGFAGVERMEGSYFTVMGLPTRILYELLSEV